MVTITATYSPEDNKLRLYASSRLDAETFARVKAAGFAWAPRQELFVSPKWTPEREDLATELAGDIEPEEMTLAERAALKAERLEGLAHKRHGEANAFARRADELSQAFYMGQPILIGHHSERKARKTQERMQAASDKSAKLASAANYWLYRATGVEHFANMKNNPRVRANRIKTLLAELRDLQRTINEAHKGLELWERFDTPEKIMWAICNLNGDALAIPWGTYSKREEVNTAELKAECIARLRARIDSPKRRRWIEHILNRLAFERSLLGPVERYEGELTPVILQAFAREHGADKPKATEIEPGSFELESAVPLPLHLASGRWLELDAEGWRDLMQGVGYEVPEKKAALPPILNVEAETLYSPSRAFGQRGEAEAWRVVKVTKAQLDAVHNDARGVRPSACGQFRFRVASARHLKIEGANPWEYVAVFVTDSKVHPMPESMAA
jgi:hypothetical protein